MRSAMFSWATVLFMSSSVLAHMEMMKPFPIKSKYDKTNTDIDYNMLRPLDPTQAGDFPCFGYHKQQSHSVEQWKAGETYEMQIAGSAAHNGGSCQLSLSYDDGATFKVIKSMIGNCPVKTSYSFTIPSDAPSGKNILFAWTWFNRTGNREMYMNCARVDIDGKSGGQLSGPEIFKANVAVTQCATIEGEDVVFPNLGPDVEYGDESLKGKAPTTVAGCGTSDGSAPPVEDGSDEVPADGGEDESGDGEDAPVEVPVPSVKPTSSSAAPSVAPSAIVSEAPEAPEVPAPSAAPEPSQIVEKPVVSSPATFSTSVTSASAPASVPTAPSAPPSTPPSTPGGACTSGAFQCSQDGNSWSICSNEEWISMGDVAAGMSCHDGAMALKKSESLGLCAGQADGDTKCSADGATWAVCLNGTWINMGGVAPGTTCSNGKVQKRSHRAGRRHHHRRGHSNAAIRR